MIFIYKVQLVFSLAFRNLMHLRAKHLVISLIMSLGTFLSLLGFTLQGNIQKLMSESLTHSVTGHIQIYSSAAKDDLALFGSGFMGKEDLGLIDNFKDLRTKLLKNYPQISAVVPMGFDMALVMRGNVLDEILTSLRLAVKRQDQSAIRESVSILRQQIAIVKEELQQILKIAASVDEANLGLSLVAQVEKDEFWQDFSTDTEAKLTFLESKIAPLSGDKAPIYLRYLGTDLQLFYQTFDKFRLITGKRISAGENGILLSQTFSEKYLKNRPARLFDELYTNLVTKHQNIAGDAQNQRIAYDLSQQSLQILIHLSSDKMGMLQRVLEKKLARQERPIALSNFKTLLTDLLTVNDQNFVSHHTLFYQDIAPLIRLYEVVPGETIVLRSYTRSGFLKSVPLKVFGIYSFAGLEDSDLAGGFNIIDQDSFRTLYGQLSDEALAEMRALRKNIKVRDVSRDNAELELFGANTTGDLGAAHDSSAANTSNSTSTGGENENQNNLTEKNTLGSKEGSKSDTLDGPVQHAAILLKDAQGLKSSLKDISNWLLTNKYPVKAVDWQTASGMVGQLVNLLGLIIVVSLFIIFLIVLVIINNSIMISIIERTKEIGTLRAVGASRTFVSSLFLVETLVTALIGALFGAVLGVFLLLYWGKVGIAAWHDILTFLFSGPRLYPVINWTLALSLPILLSLVAVATALIAARRAALITPIEALQDKE